MWTASSESLDHLAALVEQTRPSWDPQLVRIVLLNLAPRVDGTDLAIAALRAAQDDGLPHARSIGWRGKHWRDLASTPPEARAPERCQVCGKPEPRCYSERPGLGDDHEFEPANLERAR